MSDVREQLNIVKLRNNELHQQNLKLREAMQHFVDRCDRGEVRSTRTYAQFKQLLEETK